MDHSGAVGEEVMESQFGVPLRETEVTDQPRWEAALQMRLPARGQMALRQHAKLVVKPFEIRPT